MQRTSPHRTVRAGVLALAVLAVVAGACTSDDRFVAAGSDVPTTEVGTLDTPATDGGSGGEASGTIASNRKPDGFGACNDEYTGQSYHLCVWTLNESYGFQPRTAEEKAASLQPKATAGTTIRHTGIDLPWGNRDAGGAGPADQTAGTTFSWRFGCRSVCGPEATIKYDIPEGQAYKDQFSLWSNVETGPGDDSYNCSPGRYTSCSHGSMHSDEGDYSVWATFTNNPFLVQIDTTVKGTLTKTSETTSNLMLRDGGTDPLTAPQTITVPTNVIPTPSTIAWIGGFQEVYKDSNYAVSYKLSGSVGLDGSTIRMNAAFDQSGVPVATKYDSTGKAITGDPRSTWCEVIKVGTANLSCRVNSVAGKPAIVSFTLVP